MLITNRHVGWGIVVILLLLPWVPVLYGQQLFPHEGQLTSTIPIMSWVRLIETGILGIIGVGTGLVLGYNLIQGLIDDDIKFEFRIPNPFRRKPRSINHDDFLKLGTLPQDSKEWLDIYNRLNNKGQWG